MTNFKIPTQEFRDGLEDHEYIREYLNSQARFNVLFWHRGSRKTAALLNKLIVAAHQEVGLYWYLGPYLDQALKTVWIDPLTYIFRWIPPLYLKLCQVNNSDHSITFPNGSVIQIVGANHPDSLRGPKPKGIAVDEYGEIAKRWGAEVREGILEPSILSSGGWIDYSGTPKGSNDFYELLKKSEGRENWWGSLKTVDDTQMFTSQEVEDIRANATRPEYFMQEYYVQVIEGASSVFRGVAEAIKGELQDPVHGEIYIFGIDLARTRDYTVIVGFRASTNQLVYFERLHNQTWEFQKMRIRAVLKYYNKATAVIDATGMGDSFVDSLAVEGLSVSGFKISSNIIKKNLVERMVTYIENKYITYPDIPDLLDELNSFEYTTSSRNNIIYSAPPGKNDDIIIAIALALTMISPAPARPVIQRDLQLNPRTGYPI